MDDAFSVRSLNKDTGLLEDIQEVRELALVLLRMNLSTLRSRMVRRTLFPGEWGELIVQLATLSTFLEPTTQADFYRRVCKWLGIPPSVVDGEIKEYGLSEDYPVTSPLATRLREEDLPDLNPNNIVVQTSPTLRARLKRQQERKSNEVSEPPTHLSPALEEALRDILERSDHE